MAFFDFQLGKDKYKWQQSSMQCTDLIICLSCKVSSPFFCNRVSPPRKISKFIVLCLTSQLGHSIFGSLVQFAGNISKLQEKVAKRAQIEEQDSDDSVQILTYNYLTRLVELEYFRDNTTMVQPHFLFDTVASQFHITQRMYLVVVISRDFSSNALCKVSKLIPFFVIFRGLQR